jgi:hypothetical protein
MILEDGNITKISSFEFIYVWDKVDEKLILLSEIRDNRLIMEHSFQVYLGTDQHFKK